MINTLNLTAKSDTIGAWASSLCFLHCIATPFIFVAQAGTFAVESSHPWWWGTLDIVFLIISFFAVYWSTRNTSSNWMKYALWISWSFLSLIIVNEKFELWHIAEEAIYLPATALVFLHLYNRRYCRCENEECCTDNQ